MLAKNRDMLKYHIMTEVDSVILLNQVYFNFSLYIRTFCPRELALIALHESIGPHLYL